MTEQLNDRRIFVTGPAKGMGRAVSLALASSGADLVLAGRDTAPIEAVAKEARLLGRDAKVIACDVTDEDAVETAFEMGETAIGDIDGLVCVHGTTGAGQKTLWEQSVSDYRNVFDVNVLGVMLPMRAALKRFTQRRSGSIVSVAGTFGFKGAAHQSLYAATKWALLGMSKSAALEAGKFNVRLNTVCPGPVEGERLTRQAGEIAHLKGVNTAAILQSFRDRAVLKRIGQDEDIANAIVFLMSDAAKSITGQDLIIDCGGFA